MMRTPPASGSWTPAGCPHANQAGCVLLEAPHSPNFRNLSLLRMGAGALLRCDDTALDGTPGRLRRRREATPARADRRRRRDPSRTRQVGEVACVGDVAADLVAALRHLGILWSFPEIRTHMLVSSLIVSWSITEGS